MPLRDMPLFFDRLDSAAYVPRPGLEERLLRAAESSPGVLITGDPGSGKTTMLNWLGKELARKGKPVAMADAGVVAESEEFVELIRAELLAALGTWPEVRQQLETSLRVDDSFGRAVTLQAMVRRLRTEPHAYVLLDNLTETQVISTVFGRLRDLLWTTGHQWFVTANRQVAHRFLRPPADAFFAERITIPSLSAAELDAFSSAAGADEELRSRIKDVHPLPRDVVRALLNRRAPQLPATAISGPQASVLRVIAGLNRPVAADDPELLQQLGMSVFTIRRHLRGLLEAGAVEESAEHDGRPGRPRLLYTPVTKPI